MINLLKNLFKRRIWKETKRTFLRREEIEIPHGHEVFNYYLVEYTDLLSGEKKAKEVSVFKGLKEYKFL
jgi:hypothetical protein